MDWMTGTVRLLKPDKSFGFIRAQNGVDYFFHRSDAPKFDQFTIGVAVRFVPTEGAKGPRAERVEVL